MAGPVTGKKRTRVGIESFGVTLPEGVYREMIDIIEKERSWSDRVEFTREAIREKIERHRSSSYSSVHPAVARGVPPVKVA